MSGYDTLIRGNCPPNGCTKSILSYPVISLLFLLLLLTTAMFAQQPVLTKLDVDKVKPGKTINIILNGYGFGAIARIDEVYLGDYRLKIIGQPDIRDNRVKLKAKVPTDLPLGSYRFSFKVSGMNFKNWLIKSGQPDKIAAPEIHVKVGEKELIDGQTEALVFDSSYVGDTSQKTITIANNGSEPLVLKKPQISGGFQIKISFPDSLQPGQSIEIPVVLPKDTPGEYNGLLEIVSNDANESRFKVALRGWVSDLQPFPLELFSNTKELVADSSAALDFGEAEPGVTLRKMIMIRNPGNKPVGLMAPQLPQGFQIVGAFPDTLAAGDSAGVEIVFEADTTKSYGGEVVIPTRSRHVKPFVFHVRAKRVDPVVNNVVQTDSAGDSTQTLTAVINDSPATAINPQAPEEEEASSNWIPVAVVISVTGLGIYAVSYITKMLSAAGKAAAGTSAAEALTPALKFQPSKDPGSASISETKNSLTDLELRILPVVDIGQTTIRSQSKELLDISGISVRQTAEQKAADNLKRIEGIGPKISRVLNKNGITTFAQLSKTRKARLTSILKNAGITIADPTTWPTQATLAAEQEWKALDELQAKLKGGRIDSGNGKNKKAKPLTRKTEKKNKKRAKS